MPYKLPFQSYVAPYVGNANKEFDDLGQVLNTRFDKNIAQYDQLDSFANQLSLRSTDSNIKDNLVKDIRTTMRDIVESGRYEDANVPIREIAKRVANDNTIAIAVENQKRENAQRDYDNKLRSTGATIDFNPNRYNQSTIDSQTGRPRVLDFGGEEKVQDYYQKMNSMFEGVQADGYDNKSSSPRADPTTGMIYQVGSGSSARYINKNKIQQIAKTNLNNYLSTDEGIQRFRTLTSVNSANQVPLNSEDAKKVIINELVNTGLKRVFNQTGRESSTSIISTEDSSNSGNNQNNLPSQMESTAIEGGVANPTYKELSEKLVARPKGSQEFSSSNIGTGITPIIASTSSDTIKYPSLSKEAKNDMRKIQLALGIERKENGKYILQGKEVSPITALEAIRKFAEERANTAIAPAYKAFTEDEIGKAKNYVANGNYKGRGFYSYKDKKFLNFNELPEKEQEALNSGKTEGIQFSGVYDTDNPFRDMAKASGKYKRLSDWVSPEKISIAGNEYVVSSSLSDVSKKDIEFRELTNIISRPNRIGTPIYIGSGKDKELVVNVGKGLYMLKDNKGRDIYPTPFTKEQIALYMQQYNLSPED